MFTEHILCAKLYEKLVPNPHKYSVTLTSITTYLLIISDEKIEGQKRSEVTSQEMVSQFHRPPAFLCYLLLFTL